MKIPPVLLRVLSPLILLLLLALTTPYAHAFGWPSDNDNMFPPAPSAQHFINIDGRGFIIHGKRAFIVAGEMQYARIPRAQWRDRLLRIKRAGYNTIQTYAFWNFHEPREGQFDFATGNHDLNAYLQMIHSLGMYAIVRTGPYINAEWDTGGLPVWLRFKPGLLPMMDNAPFYAAVTPYWNRLFPIIVKNQITQGGPVIMVQLENENTRGGGTDLPDAYYRHYQHVALKAGIVVPYFFSGLNHSDDPAGGDPFATAERKTPWYSTEFWTGWVGWYGVSPEKQRKLVRATWKVIAYGGAGYTHYTMTGGSDFDTWNCNEQAASYDFGSPIGQAGDFRSDYNPLKRAAMFAESFPLVLANSLASDGGGSLTLTNPAVRLTKRQGKAGQIMFLDNNSDSPQAVQVKTATGELYPSAGPITLESGEIIPVVMGYPLLPQVNLTVGAARILGVTTQGDTTTLVIYGAPGEPCELRFHVPSQNVFLKQYPRKLGNMFVNSGGQIILKTVFPKGAPEVFAFKVGSKILRVISEQASLADRTWFVPVKGHTEIVCGPDYVGEAGLDQDQLTLQTEQAGLAPSPPLISPLVFTASGEFPLASITPQGVHPASATPPALHSWRVDSSVPQAQPKFDDSHWLHTDQPHPMGADGDDGAYAWYRTTLTPPKAGTYTLDISDYADWLIVFVNGQHQGNAEMNSSGGDDLVPRPKPSRLPITLHDGPNTIAILTAHYGRNKLFNYYGSMDTIDAMGVTGPVSLTQGTIQSQDIGTFRWKADDNGPTDAQALAAPGLDTTGQDWQDAHPNQDVFNGRLGYAWFRTTLPDTLGPQRQLIFASIDDVGTVYLNGKKIAESVGINAHATVSLDSAWNPKGPNVLAVLVQNTAGAGSLGPVTLLGGLSDGTLLHGWRMRGGETPPASDAPSWKPVSPKTGPGVPAWYQTTFTAMPPALVGPHPILRVQTSTLSRGFVWFNGHNLGRYPEVSHIDSGQGALVDGVYLPECWIKPGRNTLTIFDEEGVTPAKVKIIIEQVASRRDFVLMTRALLPQ
jgi:beta-galactosidase